MRSLKKVALWTGTAAVLALAPSIGVAKVISDTKYAHYTVQGTTPSEIVVDMWRKRRVNRRDFTIATIETKLKPTGDLVPGKVCELKNFQLNMTHVITLPRHVDERKLRQRTRALFRSFVERAREHELTHRRIYQGCMREFDASVRKMRPRATCKETMREMTRLAEIVGERCKARHAAFDKKEYTRSAGLPLIKQALADTKAMRAASISSASTAGVFAGDAGSFGATATLRRRERGFRDK